jgi:hypothetical protein
LTVGALAEQLSAIKSGAKSRRREVNQWSMGQGLAESAGVTFPRHGRLLLGGDRRPTTRLRTFAGRKRKMGARSGTVDECEAACSATRTTHGGPKSSVDLARHKFFSECGRLRDAMLGCAQIRPHGPLSSTVKSKDLLSSAVEDGWDRPLEQSYCLVSRLRGRTRGLGTLSLRRAFDPRRGSRNVDRSVVWVD